MGPTTVVVVIFNVASFSVCHEGNNLPSQNNSSADIMLDVIRSPERNSKSTFLPEAFSLSTPSRFGHMEMKLFSSRKSDEKEIRGLEIDSTPHLDMASSGSCSDTIFLCDENGRLISVCFYGQCVCMS